MANKGRAGGGGGSVRWIVTKWRKFGTQYFLVNPRSNVGWDFPAKKAKMLISKYAWALRRKGNKCTEILLLIWIINQRNAYQSSSVVALITNHLPHILIVFLIKERVSPDRTAQMCSGAALRVDDYELDVLMKVIYIFTFWLLFSFRVFVKACMKLQRARSISVRG